MPTPHDTVAHRCAAALDLWLEDEIPIYLTIAVCDIVREHYQPVMGHVMPAVWILHPHRHSTETLNAYLDRQDAYALQLCEHYGLDATKITGDDTA